LAKNTGKFSVISSRRLLLENPFSSGFSCRKMESNTCHNQESFLTLVKNTALPGKKDWDKDWDKDWVKDWIQKSVKAFTKAPVLPYVTRNTADSQGLLSRRFAGFSTTQYPASTSMCISRAASDPYAMSWPGVSGAVQHDSLTRQ